MPLRPTTRRPVGLVGTQIVPASLTPRSLSKIVVSDSFNRPDAATLGSADTGQLWTTAANKFSISSSQALHGTGEDSALVESGLSDCAVQCTIVNTIDTCVVFRATDKNNYWTVQWVGTNILRWKKVAGSLTSNITIGSGVAAAGDVVKVVCTGATITIYRNGVQINTVTDSYQQTSTKHGLRAGSAGCLWDDFSVSQL